MASPIYLWYTKEVFFWRSLAATLWSILCLPLLVGLLSVVLSTSLSSPVVWISDAASCVFSIYFIITVSVFAVAVTSVTWFSLPYLSVTPELSQSRVWSLLGLLRWSRVPLLVVCLLNGALCAWSVTLLTGMPFTDLVSTQEYEKVVLNEGWLILLGVGLFAGLWYYCSFFSRQEFYLRFPTIQRLKVFQIRTEMRSVLERIAWQTVHVIKYYCILYFLFGSLPRLWICSSFGISLNPESPPLDSLSGLMSVSLIWRLYWTCFTVTFALTFTLILARIFHTEPLELPVCSMLEDCNERTLSDALVCSYSPLLQHLAFYDLACLGRFVSPRLQELLSLSQPGGHPKVWMAVSQSALSVVQELTNQVKEENWSIMSKVPINPHHGLTNGHRPTQGATNSYGDRQDSSLTYRGNGHTDSHQPSTDQIKKPGFFSQLCERLWWLPGLSPLLSAGEDWGHGRRGKMFAGCHKQIWAVESLSHIAVRAYTEDRYGVVQTSLPSIFTALLDLHESIEKHTKLSTSPRRLNGSSQQSVDAVIRGHLQAVLKASLYRLTNTYKTHLQDIKLRQDELKRLTPFIHYTL